MSPRPSNPAPLERRLRSLERQRNVFLSVATIGFPLLLMAGIADPGQDPQVLRVRGLIVEDEQGRERILIGAPVPEVPHRIRTDMEKVRNTWGERYPDMDWFERLQHATNGIMILDENGHDRIVVGDPTPDPNVGRRISPSTGLVINDEEGFERSGWGYKRNDSVGLGLDHQSGEGLNLFIQPDGTVGMLIRDRERSRPIFVGNAPAGSIGTGMEERVDGMIVRDQNGPRILLDASGDTPRLIMRDQSGNIVSRTPDR